MKLVQEFGDYLAGGGTGGGKGEAFCGAKKA